MLTNCGKSHTITNHRAAYIVGSLTHRERFEFYLSCVGFSWFKYAKTSIFNLFFPSCGRWLIKWSSGWPSRGSLSSLTKQRDEICLAWFAPSDTALHLLSNMLQYCWAQNVVGFASLLKHIIYRMFGYHDRVATHLQHAVSNNVAIMMMSWKVESMLQ